MLIADYYFIKYELLSQQITISLNMNYLARGRVEVCVQNRCGKTCDDYLDYQDPVSYL